MNSIYKHNEGLLTSAKANKISSSGVQTQSELEFLSQAVGAVLGEDIKPEDFTFFQPGEKLVLKADKVPVSRTSFPRGRKPRVVWNARNMSEGAIAAYLQAGQETFGVRVRRATNLQSEKGLLVKEGIEVLQTSPKGDLVNFYARVKEIIDFNNLDNRLASRRYGS